MKIKTGEGEVQDKGKKPALTSKLLQRSRIQIKSTASTFYLYILSKYQPFI